ncbi:MAG: hypothetical protein AAF962_18165 [Actinomycetota bacterium]
MTAALQQLGAAGVLSLALVVFVTGYGVVLQFRPGASWCNDLARLRNRYTTPRSDPALPKYRPMAHGLWPHCTWGPRAWRWPLNTTRAACSMLWVISVRAPGLLGVVMRLSWYPAAGLGALAAMAQGAVLVLFISVPARAVLLVLDSITVLRGGIPASELHRTTTATAPATNRPRDNTPTDGDWDAALVDLIDSQPSEYEYGIKVDPDGKAADPVDQGRLDIARRNADLTRLERIVERQERMFKDGGGS